MSFDLKAGEFCQSPKTASSTLLTKKSTVPKMVVFLHELFMDYDHIRNIVLQKSFQFMKDLGVQATTSALSPNFSFHFLFRFNKISIYDVDLMMQST